MQNDKSNSKIKGILLSLIVFLIVVIGITIALITQLATVRANGDLSPPAERMFVVEDVVSPNEADIPKLSKIQLLREVEKAINAQKAFRSWEARYRVTSRQAPQRHNPIPEIITASQVHIISNGTKWFYENQEEVKNKSTNENSAVNTRFVSNGETISMVWPDRKNGQVQSADQAVSMGGSPTLADFLPSLPTELLARKADFPEVLDILDSPDTKLLPWYTRVAGHTCYVLERTTTLRQPVFRNRKELERWKRENPEKAEAWSKAARYGLVFNIYPRGKPGGGDTQVIEMKFRLAIAPKLGFAIVRWAYGYGTSRGSFRGFVFPHREIEYGDFRKIGKDMFVPQQMVYTKYTIDYQGQRQIAHETQLLLEEFVVNKQYQPELFKFDFPKGYNVVDANRGIHYTVGNSKEQIDALVAAAKERDSFYERLTHTQAPSLEASEWFNTGTIRLDEHKGRSIILHFWGLGCAPCIHELPRLQKQYGHTAKVSSEPLFISIHPFVDGDYLRRLKKTLDKYGITFPVMVDSPDAEGRSWGKTFKKYRVFGIPTEVRVNENGHFAGIDKGFITTTSSWWMRKSKVK